MLGAGATYEVSNVWEEHAMSISGNWEKRSAGLIGFLGEINRRKFLALSGASAAALIFGY